MYWPWTRRCRLIYADWNQITIVTRYFAVVDPRTVWSRTSSVRVKHRVFCAKNRQINWSGWSISDVFIVKINKHRIEVVENRGVNGIEGFVRHIDSNDAMTKWSCWRIFYILATLFFLPMICQFLL